MSKTFPGMLHCALGFHGKISLEQQGSKMHKLVGLFSIGVFMTKTVLGAVPISEPSTEKIPHTLTIHGDVRTDNYFWLREKTNEKVLAHLREENAYTSAMMAPTEKLQSQLYKEMRYREKEEDESVPYKWKNYFYYTKMLKGKEYAVHCRKKSLDGVEEIVLDENEFAKQSYLDVKNISIHPDEQLLSFAVDTKGDRIFTIYFKDLKTGKILDKKIENIGSDYAWTEKGKILFYTKQDPVTLRYYRIYRYDMESGISELVYEEKDEKFDAFVYKTSSDKYIVINTFSKTSSESLYIPADEPYAKFKVFLPREKNHEYSIADGGDRFFIRTNWKAKNFRLMDVGYKNTSKKHWRDVIAHRSDVFLEDVEIFKNQLAVMERKNGLIQILVMKRGKGKAKSNYIKFPDPAYTVTLRDNAEFDTNILRYDFTSMSRPESIYDYSIDTQESVLRKEKEVPGYISSNYITERIFAPAADGEKVPISLVYKKGFVQNASAPLYLIGYGAYGMSYDPEFSKNAVSLLDRGFVLAIAHIRGGADLGRKWYDDGKLLKKKNTFTDFIAAAEFLRKQKYVHPQKLYAQGGSAGGLLMGAVLNMRPDLFHGIVAQVPFVDVLTSMLDSTLPLTVGEYEEWGNPNDKKFYQYMKSYSPYDNVSAQAYPNLFITGGLNDSQVAYFEPAKWTAKLREMRTDKSKLLLFKVEMDVGHQGKSGRYEHLKDKALTYAFLLHLEGINY